MLYRKILFLKINSAKYAYVCKIRQDWSTSNACIYEYFISNQNERRDIVIEINEKNCNFSIFRCNILCNKSKSQVHPQNQFSQKWHCILEKKLCLWIYRLYQIVLKIISTVVLPSKPATIGGIIKSIANCHEHITLATLNQTSWRCGNVNKAQGIYM